MHQFAELQLSTDDNSSETEGTIWPKGGLVVYAESRRLWVCCDGCNYWFDVKIQQEKGSGVLLLCC